MIGNDWMYLIWLYKTIDLKISGRRDDLDRRKS